MEAVGAVVAAKALVELVRAIFYGQGHGIFSGGMIRFPGGCGMHCPRAPWP